MWVTSYGLMKTDRCEALGWFTLQDKPLFLKEKGLSQTLIVEFMRSVRTSGQEYGKRQTIIAYITLFILLIWTVTCEGKDESITRFVSQDQGGTLSISSGKMTLNNQMNSIVFEGDVIIEQEAMTLKADIVDVVFEPVSDKENRSIDGVERKRSLSTITAAGDIKFIHGDRTVFADKVVYYRKDEVMVFTGSPTIREGLDKLQGEKITVFILEDRVVVEGGEAIIHPK